MTVPLKYTFFTFFRESIEIGKDEPNVKDERQVRFLFWIYYKKYFKPKLCSFYIQKQ